MQPATLARFVDRLRSDGPPAGELYVVPAARYRDPAVLDAERRAIRDAPRIVAASSELAPGTCVPYDADGVSALLARTADGALGAFANACRHRGTRLIDAPCAAKAITCPYHAWTYRLDGALAHVPHLPTFGGLDPATRGLAPLPVVERDGLIWLGAGADALIAPIADDLAALDLANHVVYRRARTVRRANWKLVIEAFLDGYHIRVLHKDSIYRFFLDAAVVAEPAGPHIRAMTARRALHDTLPPRELGTPSFYIFPATITIAHPDFISLITLAPRDPSTTEWEHAMLVPAARAHEVDHWAKSWALIEDGVFQKEDLWICEQAQRAIDAGATDELVFGALERPARWFHEAIRAVAK